MSHATRPAPAERLAGLIDQLCRAVAARRAGGFLAGPLIILIWSQLRRRAARILRLAARVGGIPEPAFRLAGITGQVLDTICHEALSLRRGHSMMLS